MFFILSMVSAVVWAVPPTPGDIVSNTADLTFTGGSNSATATATTIVRTVSNIEFLKYAPGATAAVSVPVAPGQCSTSGSAAGPFVPTPGPSALDGTPIVLPASLDLIPVAVYKLGEPVFLRVVDADQNINPASVDSLLARVSVPGGDDELVRLFETGVDTGVFTGYLQSASGAATANDCAFNATNDDELTANYTDIFDGTDAAASTVLVDPYGMVFSSANGNPVDGAVVTLINANTGIPATVFGDDGVSNYPSTVTSGATATDSSGTLYTFPPGGYRFPFVAPGNYRLQVQNPAGFGGPSTVPTATLQALPGGPFAIVPGSRGEDFVVPVGPALHIDYPVDPISSAGLFLSKTVNKTEAGIGDFLSYQLRLENNNIGDITGITIRDVLPAGLRYQVGSARLDGVPMVDPVISTDGRSLQFDIGTLAGGVTTPVRYVVEVSSATPTGDAVNRATAFATAGLSSNAATATVKVKEDLFRTRSHIVGRVMVGNCDALIAPEGNVKIRMQSAAVAEEIHYSIRLEGSVVTIDDLSLIVNIPESLEYIKGSALVGKTPLADPEVDAEGLRFSLGNRSGNWSETLTLRARARPNAYGRFTTRAYGEFKTRASAQFSTPVAERQRTPVTENIFRDFPNVVWPKFDALAAVLRDIDKRMLDDFVKSYAGQSVQRLEVIGHTDSQRISRRGQNLFKDNYALSEARARSVADYLLQAFGLRPDQVTISGAGPDKPIASNETRQGKALNRRVEVNVETDQQREKTRFLILQEDSDIQTVNTRGESPGFEPATVGGSADGVAGIRLIMEDGRFVYTDEKGLYHFEGIKPGTHVVQLDTETIPETMEIFLCEQNSRVAGNPISRFVDVQGGTLWRADFYLRPKKAIRGSVGLRLQSDLEPSYLQYTLSLRGDALEYKNRRIVLTLPDAVTYQPGSAELDGKPLSDPVIEGNELRFNIGDTTVDPWTQKLLLRAHVYKGKAGEQETVAVMIFDTIAGKDQKSLTVDNALLRQASNVKRFIFNGGYDRTLAALTPIDKEKLDSIIAALDNKPVKHIYIAAHTDNLPLSKDAHFRNAQQLAAARARSIGQYLQGRLELFGRQIEAVGVGDEESLFGVRGSDNHAEIFFRLLNKDAPQHFNVSRGDSGYWDSTIEARVLPKFDSEEKKEAVSSISKLPAGFVGIKEGQQYPYPINSVRFKMKPNLKPRLLVDGAVVSNDRIGFTLRDNGTGAMLYTYTGVNFGDSGKHELKIQGIGPFGNARYEQTLTIVRTGIPVAIEVLEASGNIADGKTPVTLRLQALDDYREPIRSSFELEYDSVKLRPYDNKQLVPELRRATNKILMDEHGFVRFAPVSRSGLYTVTLKYGDIIKRVRVYVQPKFREDWILVGLAEGTAGYRTLSGNMESLEANDQKDELYTDGRLAFYAKGKVKGKWLLTVGYDSAREGNDPDRRLGQTINPDAYYTLYGDRTDSIYDAPSSEKLYVRIETDKFYTLFGDFNTDLTVTELSRYSRSLTGLKSEYHDDRFDVSAFVSQTEQGFVKDEIRGDGTSGLYRLSRQKILINSEKITIEIRDRFRSEQIISTRQLVRYIDYNIDPEAGTIYFKEPVASQDENFNPVYIVADYEVISEAERSITAGGRAAMRFQEGRGEVGATVVSEGTEGAEGELVGVDARYWVGRNTEIRAEVAGSKQNSGNIERDGNAYLAEVQHHGEQLNVKAYAREQEAGFGLGQQKGSETGTRKLGTDARYRYSERITIKGEAWHEEVLSTDANRDVANAEVQYKKDLYILSSGLRYARDKDANDIEKASQLVTGGVSRELFSKRLRLRANGEAAVGDNSNPDFPSRFILGGDYRVTQSADVFAEQEFTYGENQDSNSTRIGIRSALWSQASVTSSIENQSSENGPRTFANLGLTQGLEVNENLRLDFGLDRTQTTRDPGDVPFNNNVPPASGSVNDDFTTASVGATYKDVDWSGTFRTEARDGEQLDKTGVILGVYRQQTEGLGLATALQFFNSETEAGVVDTQGNLRLSAAYRPFRSRWIILNRLDLKYDETQDPVGVSIITRKAINNLNANVLLNRRNQIALQYGIKYVLDNIDGEGYDGITQLLGTEYRYDLTSKWDIGVRAGALHSGASNNYEYSWGLSTGYNVMKNVWLSAGYNVEGFEDGDFADAGYTAAGPYIKFRISLDQQAARNTLAWWEKRGKSTIRSAEQKPLN